MYDSVLTDGTARRLELVEHVREMITAMESAKAEFRRSEFSGSTEHILAVLKSLHDDLLVDGRSLIFIAVAGDAIHRLRHCISAFIQAVATPDRWRERSKIVVAQSVAQVDALCSGLKSAGRDTSDADG